ncbi:hypothetical protein QCA50_007941 [Cerrena zonata]|uniref:DUF6535 domain-containing protein n=1 Tax=Cerrena zonata TaxID=2478898 RepID=A0AAW0G724_9APHY
MAKTKVSLRGDDAKIDPGSFQMQDEQTKIIPDTVPVRAEGYTNQTESRIHLTYEEVKNAVHQYEIEELKVIVMKLDTSFAFASLLSLILAISLAATYSKQPQNRDGGFITSYWLNPSASEPAKVETNTLWLYSFMISLTVALLAFCIKQRSHDYFHYCNKSPMVSLHERFLREGTWFKRPDSAIPRAFLLLLHAAFVLFIGGLSEMSITLKAVVTVISFCGIHSTTPVGERDASRTLVYHALTSVIARDLDERTDTRLGDVLVDGMQSGTYSTMAIFFAYYSTASDSQHDLEKLYSALAEDRSSKSSNQYLVNLLQVSKVIINILRSTDTAHLPQSTIENPIRLFMASHEITLEPVALCYTFFTLVSLADSERLADNDTELRANTLMLSAILRACSEVPILPGSKMERQFQLIRNMVTSIDIADDFPY